MNEKIMIVAGARPNFMKVAPLIKELNNNKISFNLVHTGQHYDYNMSKVFFDDLGIPEPDIHLDVGSGSHAVQTAKIMMEFEEVILEDEPDLVIVVGDVNSTLACSLVAKKLHIQVAHIEAGLRSFDTTMPEEINRILTDQISDYLFVTEPSGLDNLETEGIDKEKIFYVGNIMIDTLVENLKKARKLDYYKKWDLTKQKYVLITIHRPKNVDNLKNLQKVVKIINEIEKKIQVFFPMHPRTKKNLKTYKLEEKLNRDNLIISEPIGYIEFLNMMENAKFILTDSGGIQEEATYLKIPVITLRENTERPITIDKGTNTLVGVNLEDIKTQTAKIFNNNYKKGEKIPLWDGKTSKRIVKILREKLSLN